MDRHQMQRTRLLELALLIFLILASNNLGAQLLSPAIGPSLSFEAAFTYPGQTLDPESEVNLEISLRNTGLKGDTYLIEVTQAPSDWSYELNRYSSIITGIFLPGEENAIINLTAYPPQTEDDTVLLPEGKYLFSIKVTSLQSGDAVESTTTLTVQPSKTNLDIITLSTSYPEIGGPSDGRFAFTLDIRNNGPDEARVNLAAEVPPDWEYSFKPGYEDKQISTIQVPRGQSRSVTLDLTPAYQADPESYPVRVMAETPLGSAEQRLTVNLSGTYKIRAGTLNDLLSTSTVAGTPVTLNLYVINEGSATQKEVTFLSVKPENWEVTFEPESLHNLPPRGRPEQVNMTITPGPGSLVGDYGVGLSVQGERTQSALDFRVTVKASSTWAWLGAIIIVLVVAALAFTFRRLGRR
jgi:uncharacterized membrane protein